MYHNFIVCFKYTKQFLQTAACSVIINRVLFVIYSEIDLTLSSLETLAKVFDHPSCSLTHTKAQVKSTAIPEKTFL